MRCDAWHGTPAPSLMHWLAHACTHTHESMLMVGALGCRCCRCCCCCQCCCCCSCACIGSAHPAVCLSVAPFDSSPIQSNRPPRRRHARTHSLVDALELWGDCSHPPIDSSASSSLCHRSACPAAALLLHAHEAQASASLCECGHGRRLHCQQHRPHRVGHGRVQQRQWGRRARPALSALGAILPSVRACLSLAAAGRRRLVVQRRHFSVAAAVRSFVPSRSVSAGVALAERGGGGRLSAQRRLQTLRQFVGRRETRAARVRPVVHATMEGHMHTSNKAMAQSRLVGLDSVCAIV